MISVSEEWPDENVGLRVDGLAELVPLHNGTPPLGVTGMTKTWARRIQSGQVA